MSSRPTCQLIALVCFAMFASIAAAATPEEPAGVSLKPKERPPEPLPNYAELWRNQQPMTTAEQSLWTAAVAMLGGADGAGCRYVRWTAPCSNCGASRPLAYSYAARISLAADTPRLLPLSVWFDVPVVHNAAAWLLERFDPRQQPVRWTLTSIGGAPPTARQYADYLAEKSASATALARAKRIAANKGKQAPDPFHPAVVAPLLSAHPPTATLRRRPDEVVFGVMPNSGSKDPAARGMQFTYAIDPATAAVKFFEQRISRPYSPHWGLKFLSFRRFAALQREPRIQRDVVVFQEEVFTARLTMVLPIASHSTHWYGDFGCS